jgi:hypothetical protein
MISGSELYDLVSNVSVLCILTAYLLLQIEKIEPTSLNLSEFNVTGSGLFFPSMMVEFNLSYFIIKSACLKISVYAFPANSSKPTLPD